MAGAVIAVIAVVVGVVFGVPAIVGDDGEAPSGATGQEVARSGPGGSTGDSGGGATSGGDSKASGTGGGAGTDRAGGAAAGDAGGSGSGSGAGSQPGGSPTVYEGSSVELERFLLRGADLSAGWVTIPEAGIEPDESACLVAAGVTPDLPRTAARIALRRGGSGPILVNAVVDYFEPEAAADAMAAARRAIEDCAGRASGDGLAFSAPRSIGTSADEAMTATIFTAERPDEVAGRLTYARVGRYTTYLVDIGFDSGDAGTADRALSTVLDRLRSG